jgi:tetratricopeptide (TPR) repeat protein
MSREDLDAALGVVVFVDEALSRARSFVDVGRSGLARAALRRASDALRHEEEERRESYVAGVTALCKRERDIALVAEDGEAASEAIVALAEAIHGANTALVFSFLNSQATALYEYGRDRCGTVHLEALIALRHKILALATSNDERGASHSNLGIALQTLGKRESGTARLEEAVAAFQAALEEFKQARAPLDWAKTQNNLGIALQTLGERESGTARLEEAVAAYRAALEEFKQAHAPCDWAKTHENIGTALQTLGERESAAARPESGTQIARHLSRSVSRNASSLSTT